ncbi:MAG: hypothetical protein ACK4QL_09105 [Pseudanabaenaceae cyanobacterium]
MLSPTKSSVSYYQLLAGLVVIGIGALSQSIWAIYPDPGKIDRFIWLMGCVSLYILLLSIKKIWEPSSSKYDLVCFLFSASICIASFWTLVFYPAIMPPDPVVQWGQALAGQYDTWHPPIMAMFMRFTQNFSGSPSLFTFCQGTLLWFSIFLLMRKLIRPNKLFLLSCCLVVFLPSLWAYTCYLVKDIWTAAMSVMGTAFILYAIDARENQQTKTSLIYLGSSIFCFAIAIAFRHNGITLVLPVFIVIIKYFRAHSFWKILIALLLTLLICISPARLIERLPNVTMRTPTALHLASMYLGTISRANLTDAEMNKVRSEFDSVFGQGAFQAAFELFYPRNYCLMRYWAVPVKWENYSEVLSFSFQKMLSSAISYPREFIEHRLCHLSLTFQIKQIDHPFYLHAGQGGIAYIMNNQLGLVEASRFPVIMHKIYNILMDSLYPNNFISIIWRTWIWMLASTVIATLALFRNQRDIVITNAVGMAYAFSFLLIDSFADWRFLFLTYICSLTAIVAFTASITIPLSKE